MTVVIDYEKCTGCGRCDRFCPVDVIHTVAETNLPVVRYPDECWTCTICEMVCNDDALVVIPSPFAVLV